MIGGINYVELYQVDPSAANQIFISYNGDWRKDSSIIHKVTGTGGALIAPPYSDIWDSNARELQSDDGYFRTPCFALYNDVGTLSVWEEGEGRVINTFDDESVLFIFDKLMQAGVRLYPSISYQDYPYFELDLASAPAYLGAPIIIVQAGDTTAAKMDFSF